MSISISIKERRDIWTLAMSSSSGLCTLDSDFVEQHEPNIAEWEHRAQGKEPSPWICNRKWHS